MLWKQLQEKNEINTIIQLDPRIAEGAVFSTITDENEAKGLIELDPCADNPRKAYSGHI